MAHKNLNTFIDLLRNEGELKDIGIQVDPELEISAIADRVVKQNGPALLFTNVKGHPDIPVLINTFGSKRRMEMALALRRPSVATWERNLSCGNRCGVS